MTFRTTVQHVMAEPTPDMPPQNSEPRLHEETPRTHPRVRARRTRFLAMLRQTANVRAACEEAGISRKTAYKWRKEERWFSAKWDEALEEYVDLADARAKQLAVEGLLEPVYCAGQLVGHRPVYSERLLLRFLERARPEEWGPASPLLTPAPASAEATSEEQRKAVRDRVQRLSPLLLARRLSTPQGAPTGEETAF